MPSSFARLKVVKGDITKIEVDAIVISTNSTFERGSLARSAHQAAGPQLKLETQKLIRCDVGDARLASGFSLPAKNVIFTVGPTWLDGQHGEDDSLAKCYTSCLKLAVENNCNTVAMPAISCGANGFPFRRSITIAVRAVSSFISEHHKLHVMFVCMDDRFQNAPDWYLSEIKKQRRSRRLSPDDPRRQEFLENLLVVKGNITKIVADAVVNAAKSSLLGGGGVDGAIHRVAGPELLQECRKLNGCPVGDARITNAYKLQARYVIHTVGPVWEGGKHEEDFLLRECYMSSLELAKNHDCRTIVFPAISCGVYSFPFARATGIAIDAVLDFKAEHGDNMQVVFCCFSERDQNIYLSEMQKRKGQD